MQIASVLLPLKWSDGSDGRIDMERRLANYRRAQEMLAAPCRGGRHAGQLQQLRLTAHRGLSDRHLRGGSGEFGVHLRLHAAADGGGGAGAGGVSLEEGHRAGGGALPGRGGRALRRGRAGDGAECAGAAFNGAQGAFAGQLEREREFTRAAAHELKTRLAVLRTHAEALREDIDAEKRGQYLDIVLDESDRMTRLVARLLELSRLEGGTVAKEPLELSALIREVWGPLELTMAQRGLKLELDLQEARVDGDRELLRQAVGNLATNALRHCADGGEIRVSLRAKDGEAILAVYNDGGLVAEEDLPRLFERLSGATSRGSRESGGTGLGLAIVRAAALAHGGGCAVENCECGVCFYVTLPVA